MCASCIPAVHPPLSRVWSHKRKLLYLADEVQGLITVLLCGGVVDDRLIMGLLEMEQAYRRRALVLKFHFEYHKLMCMLSVLPVSVITRGDFLPGLRGFDGPQGVRTELQCCSACFKLAFGRRCKGCLNVAYCSRKCQKQHWHVHKQSCGGRS